MIIWFVAASVIVYTVCSHPQCLDSQPPFIPSGNMELCKTYSQLGCCTAQDDADLKSLFEKALATVQDKRNCRSYLSTVVCLKCHSWSAHIFNAESNPNFKPKLALPCLGSRYCARLMARCRNAVKYIWGETMKARNIPFEYFCRESEIAFNKDLCYPKIKKTLKELESTELNNTVNGSLASKKGCLCVKEVARGLRSPLALVHANDQTHRMFVAEQVGVVYVILPDGTKLETPFMNITEQVLTTPRFGDERGFLGIAFHPKYRSNGRVFTYYTTWSNRKRKTRWESGTSVVSEWRVSPADPNQINPSSETVIMKIKQPNRNHNGGQILFGDDQFLYIFLGDGGSAGDPYGKYGNALNKSSLLGKVLRIDVDICKSKGKPYTIPPDNPFVRERTTRPEIFAYGARNMWRCSVDRGQRKTGYGKGRIFCGDVGQNKYEEIDIVVKGGNYGWRGREGYKCYDKKLCRSSKLDNEILPIHAYSHKVGQSIVGGYVYRGCNYPKMRGLYFFADTMNGRIFTLKENKITGKWHSKEVCMGDDTYCTGPILSGKYARMIFSFGEDEAGELYFVSTRYQNNEAREGAVYQLMDPERRADPTECKYTVKEPVPSKPNCNDIRNSWYCEYFRCFKYCNKYYVYMKFYCKHTCNMC